LFQRPAPFDLLIRNGRVLDGTGAPQTADLGIRDGRIAGMGDPMPRPPV
jgi:N-acyl-D-aspartate/D-glutamate deacylase